MRKIPIIAPDLDLPGQVVAVSCWLVPPGRMVVEGDRVIELVAGEVIVDLQAPASGHLVQRTVAEGDAVAMDQVLGYIDVE